MKKTAKPDKAKALVEKAEKAPEQKTVKEKPIKKPKKEKAVKPIQKRADASEKKQKKLLAAIGKLIPKKAEKAEKTPAVRLKPRQNPLTALKTLTIGRKSTPLTVIEIDAAHAAFHFYTMVGGDRNTLTHHVRNYAGALFDNDFFKRFKFALREFAAANPTEGIRKVTLIVPDMAVATDAIKIPTMRGFGKTGRNLPLAMNALYSNYNELRVCSRSAHQNSQHTTYAVAAIQKHIVTALYAACSENGMLVETLTFHAAATVGGATVLCPKQKNASYLLLDIKDTQATYVFVANGKATGSYTLPFGLEFLRKPKVTQEDMLFDHSTGELAVLNAREKAKSKKLTVMSIDGSVAEDEDPDTETVLDADPTAVEESGETSAKKAGERAVSMPVASAEEQIEEESDDAPEADATASEKPLAQVHGLGLSPKLFARKAPRRLPKFMQRPVPETPGAILDENFRIFVKWALTLITSNEKLTDIAKPEFVCVNLPDDVALAVDRANGEREETGIPFVRLPYAESDAEIAANLSLFGGFFPKHLGAGKF